MIPIPLPTEGYKVRVKQTSVGPKSAPMFALAHNSLFPLLLLHESHFEYWMRSADAIKKTLVAGLRGLFASAHALPSSGFASHLSHCITMQSAPDCARQCANASTPGGRGRPDVGDGGCPHHVIKRFAPPSNPLDK